MSEPTRARVFGEVADEYDAVRPGYAPDAFLRITEFARLDTGSRVLEVGAGTGKATAALAQMEVDLDAVEPDPAMAAIGARRLAANPRVRFHLDAFETWTPSAPPYTLITSFAAWHWVDPTVGYAKAHRLLEPGGALALVWNRPAWHDRSLVRELGEVYTRLLPEHAYAPMPMMRPSSIDTERAAEIDGSGLFHLESVEDFAVDHRFSADQVVQLLRTQSYHRVLSPQLAATLEGHLEAAIHARGGFTTATCTTRVYLARRTAA